MVRVSVSKNVPGVIGDRTAAAAPSQIEAGDQNRDPKWRKKMHEKSESYLRKLARDCIQRPWTRRYHRNLQHILRSALHLLGQK